MSQHRSQSPPDSPNLSLSILPPPISNGVLKDATNGTESNDSDNEVQGDAVQKLQEELKRANEEKERLSMQYQNLLAKLTTMRTTLGNKLKQDAEELDRREQLVQQLTAQNDDLLSTVETLKSELIASHEEAERALSERDSLTRGKELQEDLLRERELREAQGELERCRLERDEWERMAVQERMTADEVKTSMETLRRDLEIERETRERLTGELEGEAERASNLQSVLEDFQASKDHELRQAVKDYETQLNQVTISLAEFKHRALTAELQLEESHSNISRTQELEQEVKEKNLLIGKLRHEAVIINEHLMEALRRLRRNSSETNVDRRLVTNILLQFLTTDRADPKRFEILSLLSSVLSWNDQEREKAGLQRSGNTVSAPSFWSRSPSAASSPKKGRVELEKTDETESFSRLWVEFLLTEAASGAAEPAPPRTNGSLPGSPTISSYSQSPASGKTKRLPSFTSSAAMASSPNLSLATPPSRKGKERALS